MSDVYRDSAERYAKDAEFAAAVDMLFGFAIKHGYTPVELRQIAFAAAMKAEGHMEREFFRERLTKVQRTKP